MATREFNSAISGIPESAYTSGDEFIYPSIGYEELGETEVIYVEYEKQSGGNRATFPENIEYETRIAGILENGEIQEPTEEEYTWIREQLLESDKDFHRPIGKGLLESHPEKGF